MLLDQGMHLLLERLVFLRRSFGDARAQRIQRRQQVRLSLSPVRRDCDAAEPESERDDGGLSSVMFTPMLRYRARHVVDPAAC